MNLSIMQGYLTMFYFIDSFYLESKSDDLGALLGDLCPTIFVDCISADPAAWSTWRKIAYTFGTANDDNRNISSVELLDIIELFLKDFCRERLYLDFIYKNIRLLKTNCFETGLQERWEKALNEGRKFNRGVS